MVAFITPNRMRDEDEASKDETRLSDIDQVRNNFVYALEKFSVDHDPDTGRHIGNIPLSRMPVDVTSDTGITLGATAGSITNTIIDSSLSALAQDVLPRQEIHYVIWGAVPSGAGQGRVESMGLISHASGVSRSQITTNRMNTGVGTSVKLRYGFIDAGDPIGDSDPTLTRFAADMVVASNFPLCANHYDIGYRAASDIIETMEVQHTAAWLSAPVLLSLYGAEEIQVGQTTQTDTYTAHELKSHSGQHIAVVVGARATDAGGSNAAWLLPAWDDTNCYIVVWRVSGTTITWTGAITFPLVTGFALDTPSAAVADTFAKAQGYPHEPAEWSEIAANAANLEELLYVQHNVDGSHKSIDIAELSGATAVATAMAVTADTTVGNTTETLIEASDPGDVLYFVGLVGESGSGIVSGTISRDGTEVYLVLRRITAGTTNNFTATIWRVSRT